jgi:hypothetical protein
MTARPFLGTLVSVLLMVSTMSYGYQGTSISSMSQQRSVVTTVRIAEHVWRKSASDHQSRIQELLLPGLTALDDPINSGRLHRNPTIRKSHNAVSNKDANNFTWTALDPKHPVYNFLIEYYGLKGMKGTKRLARWSPSPLPNSNILLQGASEDDFGSLLHMRGAVLLENGNGILYSPSEFFGKGNAANREDAVRAATPYLWNRSILQSTAEADPVLNCFGLHEWAMQYMPAGAPLPPSAKYQEHLPLRVDRNVINETIERKGVSCTHVDALRYFSPAAGPLNLFGAKLERIDQLRLEQPACVHAHMDLLKLCLRLSPFCDAKLVQRVLEISLAARKLDVAASPYDISAYGVDAVPVEAAQGRAQYRQEQISLMRAAEPVRQDLLRAYDLFLQAAFDEDVLALASATTTIDNRDKSPQLV